MNDTVGVRLTLPQVAPSIKALMVVQDTDRIYLTATHKRWFCLTRSQAFTLAQLLLSAVNELPIAQIITSADDETGKS